MTMRAPRSGTWQRGSVRWLLHRGLAIVVLFLAGWEPLWRMDSDVAAGNQAYAEGRFDEAIAAYQRAQRSGLDERGLAYDLGTATMGRANSSTDEAERARSYAEALGHLGHAANGAASGLAGKAHYNRGNVFMKLSKFDDAIGAYKDALRADPALDAARMNLELALRQRARQQQAQGGQGQPQPGEGQPQPGQGQPPPGQGQPPPGQGQPPPGQGQPPQPGEGQLPSGQDQPPDSPNADDRSSDSADGTAPPPDSGPAAPPPPSQTEQADPSATPGSQDPSTGQNPPSPAQPRWPHDDTEADTPNTSPASKLERLEEMSRQLRRDTVRRKAGGNYRLPRTNDW